MLVKGKISQTNPNNKITAWYLPCGVVVAGAGAAEENKDKIRYY
jgi:hypothetical protein